MRTSDNGVRSMAGGLVRLGLACCAGVGGVGVGVGGGCSSNRPPEVRVESVRVAERTSEGVVVEVTIAGVNGNAEPLPLKRVDYSVSVNGRTVFTGARSPEATLSAGGERVFRVPAPVALEAMPGGAARVVVTGWLTYTEPGKIAEILFDAEVSQPTVSFSGSAELESGGS